MDRLDTPLCRELDRQGRTRRWIALELEVRPWTFSRIEAGRQPAPLDWYPRAAALLGVSEDSIRPKATTQRKAA